MIFARATNNKKKLAEIQRILNALGHEAKSLAELGVCVDAEETGTTFEENALIKAKAVARATGMPSISDDSGLEVDALGGEPGVYTARYRSKDGSHPTDDENIDKLLYSLKDVPKENRTARFVSAVALYIPGDEPVSIVKRGTCEGRIGFERRGSDGFGYDPVFMMGDISYAEMTAREKDAVSHRGKALRLLGEEISKISFE